MLKKRYYAGMDVGTSYIKAVIINSEKEIIGSSVERSGPDLRSSIGTAFQGVVESANISRSHIGHITSTGFGRKEVSFADSVKTEISCHAKGVYFYFNREITLVDIGGQDTKIIKIDHAGKIKNFKMNRKCAAGTGAFIEEIAGKLNVRREDMNALAAASQKDAALGSYCTVFASTEILTRIRDGEKIEDMVKGVFGSVVKRIIEMDTLDGTIVMSGGVISYNDFIVEILSKCIEKEIRIPPDPQLIGAFGAALYAKEYAASDK